jgi:type IV pilus assembly protein PilY1
MTSLHTQTTSLRSGLIHLVLLGLICSPHASVQADPAQQPLVKRGDGSVPPNIFYTLDDSGSMGMTYAPSDDTIWPGENIYNSTQRAYLTPVFHPTDTLVASFGVACYVRTPAPGATDTTSVQAMKLRSPDFNKIYYNPAITYQPWARPNPTDANFGSSPFTAAPIDPRKIYNSADTGAKSGNINLETAYNSGNTNRWCTYDSYANASSVVMYPATYYLKSGTGFVRVSLGKDENGTPFHTETTFQAPLYTPSNKATTRTDCVTSATKCTLAEERQNFANWYTYYRTRSLLARGASSLAFSKLEDPMRVGYGRINYGGSAADGITGAPTNTIERGVRDFTVGSSTRQAFFDWLYTVPASGGTPLRRAMDDVGRYFSLTDTKGPWGNNPGTADTKAQASCRKSFHILMTVTSQTPYSDCLAVLPSSPLA